MDGLLTNYGGAIYNYDDSLKVTNSTFTNNTAQAGGAIWNYGGNINSRIIQFNRIVVNKPDNSEIYSEYGTVDATLNWRVQTQVLPEKYRPELEELCFLIHGLY